MTSVAVVADVADTQRDEGGIWDDYTPDDPAALAGHLDDILELLTRFVAFPTPAAAIACALWAMHAWLLESFESTPRLAVLSAEKGSGKTRVLEILELIVPSPLHTVNMSPAALFRMIEDQQPTLLLDEADTYLGVRVAKEHEELRGLVNAGHRRGATAYRCDVAGKKVSVKEYKAYAAVALAGIGDLPDTILDRSIVIAMKRRRAEDQVEPFRHRKVAPTGDAIRSRLEAWATANSDRVMYLEPELPAGVVDRAADVWEPLIVLGDLAGDRWSELARSACIELNTVRQERDPSLGIRLLTDLRMLFTAREVERLHTETILEALVALDEAPWGDLYGHQLNSRGLSKRLKPYDVRPKDVRIGDVVRKGYDVEALHDAWSRYLPPLHPPVSATSATAATDDLDDYEARYPDLFDADDNAPF